MIYTVGDMVEVLSLQSLYPAIDVNIGDIVEVMAVDYTKARLKIETKAGSTTNLDFDGIAMAKEEDMIAAARNLNIVVYPTYIPQEY